MDVKFLDKQGKSSKSCTEHFWTTEHFWATKHVWHDAKGAQPTITCSKLTIKIPGNCQLGGLERG